jgi:hypothetical protein
MIATLCVACGGKEKAKNVAADKIYSEKDDAGNSMSRKPEATGLNLDGKDWIEISGTVSTVKDRDYYRVDLAEGMKEIYVQVVRNNEVHPDKIGFNLFPITILAYDKDDKLGTQYIMAASGKSIKLKKEYKYVVVNVYGKRASKKDKDQEFWSKFDYKVRLK